MKVFRRILTLVLALLLLALPALATSAPEARAISFVDDEGFAIALDQPATSIISLYSAHTENLYALGAGARLIGACATSTYPPEAAFLPRYEYTQDPEVLIAANPDLILIRPFVTKKAPDFVAALRKAGIPVVSLLPESLALFDDYIQKLALLTGTSAVSEQKLADFHAQLDAISQKTERIPEKTRTFFESTETELRTVTDQSMAGQAIGLAGGINVAAGAPAVSKGSTIAAFGAEKILMHAGEIDVYVSQRGAMNAGGDAHAIAIRPGFSAIKAIRDGRILTINEKLISSPTFRYTKGVKELARFFYPDVMDDLTPWRTGAQATRRDFAHILTRARHLPVFVPSSSKYYTKAHKGHVYGLFEDVLWTDADFDAIETCVQAGYIASDELRYDPSGPVTRDALARAIFLIGDFSAQDAHAAIGDLAMCAKAPLVQTLVDQGVFALESGQFNPTRPVTNAEILDALSHVG
ncbi:MAG: ABC transporter substrate-binding protein [Clostridia bacterium]